MEPRLDHYPTGEQMREMWEAFETGPDGAIVAVLRRWDKAAGQAPVEQSGEKAMTPPPE